MRIPYFDSIRASAILLVVFIHSLDTAFRSATVSNTANAWLTHQFFHTIGRYAVPLFVMLTGALILTRHVADIAAFLRSKLPKFIGIIAITSLIYGVFSVWAFDLKLSKLPKSILDGKPLGAYHLWYMYMLVGLYASLPFLSRMLERLNEREVRMAITVGFLFVMLPWTLSMMHTGVHYPVATAYYLQTYAIYAVSGYWLVKYDGLKHWGIQLRTALLVFMLLLTVGVKYIREFDPQNIQFPDGITWYDSAFIYIAALLLFSLFRDFRPAKTRLMPLINYLSRISLSIYLWHLLGIYCVEIAARHLHLGIYSQFLLFNLVGILFGISIYHLLRKTRLSWLVA